MEVFDEFGADGQTSGECGGIVELVGPIGGEPVRLRWGAPAGREFGADLLGGPGAQARLG